MSFRDFEKKLEESKSKPNPHIPTREEIDEAIYWVVENFPYAITPSQNPGQGAAIQQWLDTMIGPMDDRWTWLDKEIRFRTKEDYIMYGLAWQKLGEDNV